MIKGSFFLRYAIVFFLLLIISISSHAQKVELVHEIHIPSNYFTVDHLGNFYVVTPSNQVLKFDAKARPMTRFSDNSLGELAMLDASNPTQLYLYYPNFQTVKILDRNLGEINTIELFDLNSTNIPAICASNDNQIWIFDADQQQLKKLSINKTHLFQSNDLRMLLTHSIQPSWMQEYQNHLFLFDANYGLFIFNAFGNLVRQIELKESIRPCIIEEYLIYTLNGEVYFLNWNTGEINQKPLLIKEEKPDQIVIQSSSFFIKKEQLLKVYQSVGEQ